MTASCQPLPHSVAEEMLQVVARAMCDRPGENAGQRNSRTRQMVLSTMGLGPRDGLEYMISTIVFGHYNLILEMMHDAFQFEPGTVRSKAVSTVMALERTMIALIKEFRMARRRPDGRPAEGQRAAAEMTAAEMTRVEPDATPPAAGEAETPAPPAPAEPAMVSPEEPAIAPPADPGEPAMPRRASVWAVKGKPATTGQAREVPRDTGARPEGAGEGTLQERLAAFQAAVLDVARNLKEAEGPETAPVKPAPGD